ncbi:glutamic acid-rich protein-like [Ipomoea triloba]|uniref:glutamic acid-rich protein-like n=1 Tax=Ipomoea triloba TaxID=35885 RepID=UPI00125DAD8F|nr:glutamic acid-rich protein-like [Ipomoea triloba]
MAKDFNMSSSTRATKKPKTSFEHHVPIAIEDESIDFEDAEIHTRPIEQNVAKTRNKSKVRTSKEDVDKPWQDEDDNYGKKIEEDDDGEEDEEDVDGEENEAFDDGDGDDEDGKWRRRDEEEDDGKIFVTSEFVEVNSPYMYSGLLEELSLLYISIMEERTSSQQTKAKTRGTDQFNPFENQRLELSL